MKFAWIILILIACGTREEQAENSISKDVLRLRIATLSSDSFEGRAPNSGGTERAMDYIISQYKLIGMQPINGSYQQDLKLIGSSKKIDESSVSIRSGKSDFDFGNDKEKNPSLTYFSTSQKEQVDIKDAEIVFVGYAVEAAEYNWDDFKGADLNGKIMLILNNDPQIMNGDQLDENYFKGETRTYYGRYTYKFEQAMRKGAAGAILIHTTRSAGYPFRVLQGSGKNTSYAIDIEGSGYQLDFVSHLDSLTSDKIARKMGKSLPELFQMALDPNFKPVSTGLKLSAHIETALSEVKTSNLFAKIEGSDPDLKSQHILFSAHYDHLGMNHTDTEGDDEIFNGAWDNASGSASLLSLAEAFTKVKPKRSIIILHCAAEESGLLGSEYFVKRPPLPLNQIVADINIDMPNIYGISSDMAVIGVNSNSMGDELKRFAKSVMVDEKQSLRITDDPDPNAGLFYRSDQVHFAKAGIPAIYIESGRKFIGKPDDFYERKNEEVYHRVTDQIDDDWDLNGLERDLRLIFRTIISVANSTEQPKWHSGNEFESAYKNLYK